jgi:hypothetical protein
LKKGGSAQRGGISVGDCANVMCFDLAISFAVFESENYEKPHISLIFLILEHTYGLSKGVAKNHICLRKPQ